MLEAKEAELSQMLTAHCTTGVIGSGVCCVCVCVCVCVCLSVCLSPTPTGDLHSIVLALKVLSVCVLGH